jgi:alpha-glucosidase
MYYGELEKDCDKAIIGFIEKARWEDIPVDGFQLSSGYTVGAGNKRHVFTWNTARFSDPDAFFARMNELGAPVSPNIKPGILLTNPNYDEFAKVGGFVRNAEDDNPYVGRWWGGPGSFVDFTNPKAREVWKNFVIGSLSSKGVSSIFNDNCEYELTDYLARCDGDGAEKPVGAVRNIQSNLMSRVRTSDRTCSAGRAGPASRGTPKLGPGTTSRPSRRCGGTSRPSSAWGCRGWPTRAATPRGSPGPRRDPSCSCAGYRTVYSSRTSSFTRPIPITR